MLNREKFSTSFTHPFHPVFKLVCYFLFVLALCFSYSFFSYFFLTFLFFICYFLSKKSFSCLFQNSFLYFFSFFLFLLFLLLTKDFFLAFSILFKICFFFFSLSFFLITISIPDLHYALKKVLSPLHKFSISVPFLSYKVLSIFLYLNIMTEKSNKIKRSLKEKCPNIESKFSLSILQVKMLFLHLRRNTRIHFLEIENSMALRNFSVKGTKTYFKRYSFGIFDTLFCFIYVIITVGIILVEAFL